MEHFWIIPFIPLAGFLINGLLSRFLNERAAGIIASAAVLASFLLAVTTFLGLLGMPADTRVLRHTVFMWLQSGAFEAPVAFLIDPLSMVMVLVVTGVGFLIHVYSIGYMHGDPGAKRFFTYLNLFMFAMLILVMADNLLLLFVGWEGVGLCSYLLIGYWYEKDSAANAGKKAFIVNRIGDFGFLLATLLTFWTLGTINFEEMALLAPVTYTVGGAVITTITLLFFLGATGKSAQLPLYVWLPDAMEGPTPVSALIHAATMVTAGVYLLCRMNVLYAMAPVALLVVLVVGMLTALFAGTIGLAQTDIKKVLAYSTVSQLGFMFAACGVGAFVAAIFHLAMHAFFKALLFLGSGSVIHGAHGEQEMPKMGGLRARMPATHITFVIGSLALAGVLPFAGFFSKDEILYDTFASGHWVAWLVLTIAAVCTAIYITRAVILTFYGKPRDKHLFDHAHESPAVMTLPLWILAALSTVGGFIGIPILAGGHRLKTWLSPVFGGGHGAAHGADGHGVGAHAADALAHGADAAGHAADAAAHGAGAAVDAAAHGAAAHGSGVQLLQLPGMLPPAGHNLQLEIILIVTSLVLALVGIFIGYSLYRGNSEPAGRLRTTWGGLHRLLAGKYFVDELYGAVVINPVRALSGFFWRVVDVAVIDALVNGVGSFMRNTGDEMRRWQTGLARTYAMAILIGCLLIVAFVLFGRWA